MPKQDREPPSRLVVAGEVYHQPAGGQPTSVPLRYARALGSAEQAYRRDLVVTGEWRPLEAGWVVSASLLIIENKEGAFRAQPTAAERAEAAARVVEVACPPGPGWLVPPGESFAGCPSALGALRLRCLAGEARVTVTVVPA